MYVDMPPYVRPSSNLWPMTSVHMQESLLHIWWIHFKRVIYRYSYSTLCYITIIEHHFKIAFSAVKLHHFFLVLNNFRKKCSRKGLKLFAIGVFLANWIHIFTYSEKVNVQDRVGLFVVFMARFKLESLDKNRG